MFVCQCLFRSLTNSTDQVYISSLQVSVLSHDGSGCFCLFDQFNFNQPVNMWRVYGGLELTDFLVYVFIGITIYAVSSCPFTHEASEYGTLARKQSSTHIMVKLHKLVNVFTPLIIHTLPQQQFIAEYNFECISSCL